MCLNKAISVDKRGKYMYNVRCRNMTVYAVYSYTKTVTVEKEIIWKDAKPARR